MKQPSANMVNIMTQVIYGRTSLVKAMYSEDDRVIPLKMYVFIPQPTGHQNPEDRRLPSHYCKNLRSHTSTKSINETNAS
jgi:hypothetical protein